MRRDVSWGCAIVVAMLVAGGVLAEETDPARILAEYQSGSELPGRPSPGAGAPDHANAPLAPPTRDVPFANDVAAAEIRLGDYVPQHSSYDAWLGVVGRPDGRAALSDSRRLSVPVPLHRGRGADLERARWSSPATRVRSREPVGQLHAVDADGTIYVATRPVADPLGSCGLQFFRSDDVGQTWFRSGRSREARR